MIWLSSCYINNAKKNISYVLFFHRLPMIRNGMQVHKEDMVGCTQWGTMQVKSYWIILNRHTWIRWLHDNIQFVKKQLIIWQKWCKMPLWGSHFIHFFLRKREFQNQLSLNGLNQSSILITKPIGSMSLVTMNLEITMQILLLKYRLTTIFSPESNTKRHWGVLSNFQKSKWF